MDDRTIGFACRRDNNPGGNEPVLVGVGRCIRETEKAILVELDTKGHRDTFGFVTDNREVWIPKACVHDDSEVYKAKTDGRLIVKRYFAEKEGLGNA
jgi:hypothetical protein